MKKELTKQAADARKILILVGRGKSTLTSWTLATKIYYGIRSVLKNEEKIRIESVDNNIVIHLQSEDEYKKLGAAIRRRALLFKIDF